MPQIRLLKEPGYIYDLIFVFYLRFNTHLYINSLNNEKKADVTKYFNDLLEQFPDIPEDLFVFFHAIENGRCFIATKYFNEYKESFTTTYDFKFMQKELSDRNRLMRELIHFYFHELTEEELDECVKLNLTLFSYIKKSKYSDEEKRKLYEFFIEPEPYLQTLQYELMAKELMLSQYYEKHYQKILEVHNKTTFETISKSVKDFFDLSFIDINNQKLYVSYCILRKFCINFFGIQEGAIFLLGYDYLSIIDDVKNRKDLDLQDFGNALCEESRVKILELLLQRKEVTCKDLEKIFSFSGSTAYHHITMMTKIGVVKTRNEGKTILYSLNRAYFDAIIGVLSKYSNNAIQERGVNV